MNRTKVGKLNKAFGVKGLIKVVPDKGFEEDLKKCDVWFIQRGKDVIPYFVEFFEEVPHFMIKFEDVDSPESAKSITGCPVFLKNTSISFQKEDGEEDLEKLIGFEVENSGTVLGVITNIEQYPQQLMAFIEGENSEILMPLSPEYILDIDLENRRLLVDLPEGFVESQN